MEVSILGRGIICQAGQDIPAVHQHLLSAFPPGCRQAPWLTLSQSDQELLEQLPCKDSRRFRRSDRCVKMAINVALAAQKELEQDSHAFGVFMGSSRGAAQSLETFLAAQRPPAYASPVTTLGHLAASVAASLGCTGMVQSLSTTCATGLNAVITAALLLESAICLEHLQERLKQPVLKGLARCCAKQGFGPFG